jgi:hypothetical protein
MIHNYELLVLLAWGPALNRGAFFFTFEAQFRTFRLALRETSFNTTKVLQRALLWLEGLHEEGPKFMNG